MPTTTERAGGEEGAWRSTSLAVQIVLYNNDIGQQQRLAAGIAAAVRHMRAVGGLDRVLIRYGDCSRWPCISQAEESTIRTIFGDTIDDLTFTFFGANLGSAGGSNALAQLGDDDIIWILNPDTYPAPTAGAALLDALRGDRVGVTEARQIPIEHPKDYDLETGDTSWASGCSMMLRRDAFEAVGGFDAHFFPLYCDDVDLSWRLRAGGWAVCHVPRAVVVHDKPIPNDGIVRGSDLEARSSHLARLWLYRRYDRPDLEQAFLESIDPTVDSIETDAISEFRRRVAQGDVPDVLPGAADVAQFIEGEYAAKVRL